MKRILFLMIASLLLLAGVETRAQSRLENGSHSTIGYINSNGRVENGSHSTIGYISNGRVENGSHSTIGYYPNNVKKEWVAFFFFFMHR